MEKTIGNYIGQPNRDFPLDCETLAALAENQAMAEILGNICGDKTILLGCELNTAGTLRSEGYVFLRTQDYPEGEVLRWTGGAVGDMHVEKTDVSVTADGYQYPKAYTRRSLAPGLGTETYRWEDFAEIRTNAWLSARVAALEEELANAVREPIGVIKMWAGTTPPENYLMCDGGAIPNDEQYADLRAVVGNNTPDLKGRFIVGYSSADAEYNAIGKTGGEKKHQLSIGEIPSHSHTYKKAVANNSNVKHDGYDSIISLNYEDVPTSSVGSGQSHENRPPYYVLAYIIKAK